MTIFHNDHERTVDEVRGVLQGGTISTITVNVKHAATRSASGTSLLTGAQVVNSLAAGNDLTLTTTSADRIIPAGSYVWLETSAGGGSGHLHVSLKGH